MSAEHKPHINPAASERLTDSSSAQGVRREGGQSRSSAQAARGNPPRSETVGFLPVVRWFGDRPKRDATRLCVYWRDVHLFVFHWGVTVRWRRPENFWRHATAYVRARPKERGRGGMFSIGTWLTEDGVTERVAQTKKYVAVKVLG